MKWELNWEQVDKQIDNRNIRRDESMHENLDGCIIGERWWKLWILLSQQKPITALHKGNMTQDQVDMWQIKPRQNSTAEKDCAIILISITRQIINNHHPSLGYPECTALVSFWSKDKCTIITKALSNQLLLILSDCTSLLWKLTPIHWRHFYWPYM